MNKKQNRLQQAIHIVCIILLMLTGLNALAAGYSFISDPTGAGLGINTSILIHSGFKNFFIPGIILFAVNGLLCISVAICAMAKAKHYALLIVLQGILLAGWILVQLIMLRFIHALHIIIFITAIGLVAGGLYLHFKKNR